MHLMHPKCQVTTMVMHNAHAYHVIQCKTLCNHTMSLSHVCCVMYMYHLECLPMRAGQIPEANRSCHYRHLKGRYPLESGLHDEIPTKRQLQDRNFIMCIQKGSYTCIMNMRVSMYVCDFSTIYHKIVIYHTCKCTCKLL